MNSLKEERSRGSVLLLESEAHRIDAVALVCGGFVSLALENVTWQVGGSEASNRTQDTLPGAWGPGT